MWLRRINSPIAAELLYSSRHSGGDYSASAMIEKTIALPRLHHGSGPSVNSGASAQLDPSDAPRPGLSWKGAAPQSDATLLCRSFSALLKIAPSHPVVLLGIASICLKLKRARRGYEVLSRMGVRDWERGVRPKRLTKAAADIARLGYPAESEGLLRLALAVAPNHVPALLAAAAMLVERTRQIEFPSAVIRENGREHWKEAEHLLRRAIAADPNLSAPRLALAALLLERLRYVEALSVAAEGVRCFPSSLELRLVLARTQFQLRQYADAAKTIEALLAVAPEHAWAWYELGKTARNSYERLGLADTPFQRAVELAEKDAGLLAAVAQNFLYDLNFVMAAECYERLLQVEPAMGKNFVVCRQYAMCLNVCGRNAEAVEMIGAGLENCRSSRCSEQGRRMAGAQARGVAALVGGAPIPGGRYGIAVNSGGFRWNATLL